MLLQEHPDCFGGGPVAEDFLVHASPLLRTYVNSVQANWNPVWGIDQKVGPPGTLLRDLGEGLRRFLQRQLPGNTALQPVAPPSAPASEKNPPKILLTKTPSVVGAEHFFDLFPDDYLILLVRDGRAVVESGVRSFGWNHEDATRSWASKAKTILALKEKYKNKSEKLLLLKYEDVVKDEKTALLGIFDFLALDPDRFDFDRIKSLGVIGSSETKKEGGAVHWRRVEKKQDFNPLGRFSHWDRKKHDRFNWLAGHAMTQFGYNLETTGTNRYLLIARQRLLDLTWKAQKISFMFNPKNIYKKIAQTLGSRLKN